MITLFLIGRTQIAVLLCRLLTHLLDCGLSVLFEARLATIDMIKSSGGFPRKLNMSNLVGTHRHVTRSVDENVGGLQQGVTEEAIGGQILLLQLVLLILVARDALQPA